MIRAQFRATAALSTLLACSMIQPEMIEEKGMSVSGAFDVDLQPQSDEETPAGRMLIDKTYHGPLSGRGLGQMISKRTEKGSSVYAAIEEFTGTLDGKSGGFTLFHRGLMSATEQSLEVIIVEGSGSGELVGVIGSLKITQDDDGHRYTLDYSL